MFAGAMVVAAVANARRAKDAERENGPVGYFVEVNGIRLHYYVRGQGDPLVLLHGNGSMIQDFQTSGLIEMAARRYRVIAIDRPGFGYSTRPRGTIWSAEAQADLIHAALKKIGVPRAIVLGHSWGASVAAALALKYPETVSGVVLASGYYYPTARCDVAVLSAPAVPVVGDIMRYTVSPIVGRLIWPRIMRKIFGPAPVPTRFQRFPKEMALRPSQLRAAAAESALMIPNTVSVPGDYSEIRMPVAIIAGDEDRLVDFNRQSERLHRDIRHSILRRVAGAGHMVHHSAPDEVMSLVDEVAAARQ